MNAQNPAVKSIINECDIHGCIIDGGFGVNVISEATTCSVLTVGPNLTTRFLSQWPHIHDLGYGSPVGCPRSLLIATWMSLVTHREHQATLAAKHDLIPM